MMDIPRTSEIETAKAHLLKMATLPLEPEASDVSESGKIFGSKLLQFKDIGTLEPELSDQKFPVLDDNGNSSHRMALMRKSHSAWIVGD